jgi:hypothetical protein
MNPDTSSDAWRTIYTSPRGSLVCDIEGAADLDECRQYGCDVVSWFHATDDWAANAFESAQRHRFPTGHLQPLPPLEGGRPPEEWRRAANERYAALELFPLLRGPDALSSGSGWVRLVETVPPGRPVIVANSDDARRTAVDLAQQLAAWHRLAGAPVLGPFFPGLLWRGVDGRLAGGGPSERVMLLAAPLARIAYTYDEGLRGPRMLLCSFRKSPEEVRGLTAAPATDVFHWAYLIFHLFAGTPPFPEKASVMEYLGALAAGKALPLRHGDFPPSLSGLVQACLAPDPAARPSLESLVTETRAM